MTDSSAEWTARHGHSKPILLWGNKLASELRDVLLEFTEKMLKHKLQAVNEVNVVMFKKTDI